MLLQLFWRLLEFNPDGDASLEEPPVRINTTSTVGGHRSPQPPQQQKEDPEAEFGEMLARKFKLFKNLLFEAMSDREPALQLTQEEVKRVADYMKESYFKHLRLYDFVLNNKQLCEVKRLTLNVNEPIVPPALSDALLLGAEEALGFEDDTELVR